MKDNISRSDLDAVINHLKLDDPRLTSGEHVREFEALWSDWLGVRYSVFVNSGASANLLSMATLKRQFPEGGEVIVPPLTWSSDISSVLHNGFKPVFADIDPRSLSMCDKEVVNKITDKTRAIFLTHAQGFSGLSEYLLRSLEAKNIALIEDVCEAHGAIHEGRKLGSFGWMSNFSFYYAHHMSTIEGGMICTDDFDTYQVLRMLRGHGLIREIDDMALRDSYAEANPELNSEFIFELPAYNVRNTEIGGILGKEQLKRLDKNIESRQANFRIFLDNINPNMYRTDFKIEGSSNYAFNLILREKDMSVANKLMEKLTSSGIEFRRGSAGGGNQLRQPYLKSLCPDNYFLEFPETEHIHFFGFYIGNYPSLKKSEILDICSVINSIAS